MNNEMVKCLQRLHKTRLAKVEMVKQFQVLIVLGSLVPLECAAPPPPLVFFTSTLMTIWSSSWNSCSVQVKVSAAATWMSFTSDVSYKAYLRPQMRALQVAKRNYVALFTRRYTILFRAVVCAILLGAWSVERF